jgi:hypothetical protein
LKRLFGKGSHGKMDQIPNSLMSHTQGQREVGLEEDSEVREEV